MVVSAILQDARLGFAMLTHVAATRSFEKIVGVDLPFASITLLATHLLGNTSLTQKKSWLTRPASLHWFRRYLFRSPFYEKYTSHRVKAIADGVGNRIPLVGYVVEPCYEYMVAWQKLYSYSWCT
jgi:hypothetical protein